MTNIKKKLRGPLGRLNNWFESLSEAAFAYVMMLPVLVIFSVIALWPLYFTLETSLYADSFAGFRGEFVGVDNYVDILSGERDNPLIRPFFDLSNPYRSILPATLLFTFGSVAFITVFGLIEALVLNKEFRGRSIVRVAVLLPWAVPIIIQGMIFYLLFVGDAGLGTRILNDLGILSNRPLSNSGEALAVVIMADVWKQTAFVALIVLAGLQSIDRRLYDVARVSGASRWQQFRLVTLPQITSVLLVALLFATIAAMRVYGQIEAITNCSTVPSLTCAVVGTFNASRYGTSAALAFITAALIGIVALIYLIKFRDSNGGI